MKNPRETSREILERRAAPVQEGVFEIVSEKINSITKRAEIPSDQKIAIKEVRGEDANAVFRLDGGGSAFALKVFSDSGDAGQFYANKAFNELAAERHVPTPRIIDSSDNRRLLPFPWILWEWAPGRPSCEIEDRLSRTAAAVKTGAGLRQIHAIETPGFGRPKKNGAWTGKNIKRTLEFFAQRIERLVQNGGNAFSENELRQIFDATSESQNLLSYSNPRLLHGDVTGGNIIVSDSGDIVFIDPGEIITGDPMADLGYTQTTRLSPIFCEGVWQGYTEDNPLTDEEYDRFLRWRLLWQSAVACRAALNKSRDAEKYIADAILFLREIRI